MSNFLSLLFYIFSFLISIFCMNLFYIFYKKNHKVISSFFILAVFSILTIISGTRYNVGADYGAYIRMFQYKTYGYLEFGSRLLYKISTYITEDPQFIIILFSALTNFAILMAIYRLKDRCKPSLVLASYLFIFFPFSFNIIRQSLAMAICFLAFTYLKQNTKKAYLLVILAGLIHSSAFLMLLFFIVYAHSKEEKIYRNIIILFFVFILVAFFYLIFSSDLGISVKYGGYLKSFSFSTLEYITLISYVPFWILIFLFKKTIRDENDKSYSILATMYLVGCLFEFLFSSTAISRFGLYFSFFIILLFPLLLEKIKDHKSRNVIKCVYLIFLCLYFAIVYYYHGRAIIFPYDSTLFH